MPTTTDLCSICNLPREKHTLLNHEFNTEGRLVPKQKKPIRVQPAGTGAAHLTGLILRLVHVLASKGVLTDDDIKFITSGPDNGPSDSEPDRGVGIYPARPPSGDVRGAPTDTVWATSGGIHTESSG